MATAVLSHDPSTLCPASVEEMDARRPSPLSLRCTGEWPVTDDLWDRRWRLVVTWWAVVLYGYALLDKGFAYLHIPGTPLFIGELSLLPVLALIALQTQWFHGARLLPLAALGAYIGWAGFRLAQSLPAYKLDALRDSAMWYYALVSLLFIAWFRRLGAARAVNACFRFARVLSWPLLLWTPVAVLAERAGGTTAGPVLPMTGVSVLSHKPSNLAPLLTMIAFSAWQDRWSGLSTRRRTALFTLALIDIAAVGTQTRGGFLAAAFGLAIGSVVIPARVRSGAIARRGLAICLSFFLLAYALDLKVAAGRDLGVRQLTNNMLSLVGLNSEDRNDPVRGTLEGNAEWRERLWTTIIAKTFLYEHEVTGWGFGPNLGDEIGFENQLGDGSLRSPHNSHLSVFARLGAIGLTLWVVLWSVWSAALVQVARCRDLTDDRLRVAAAMLVAMMAALHVNAYFDPAYESPQAGAWLWAVFGVGCGVLLARRAVAPPTPLERWAHRPRWSPRPLSRWLGPRSS